MGMTHELKFSVLSMGRGAWPKQFLRSCTGRDPCLLPPSHRHQFSDVHDDMEGWGTAGWRSRVTLSVTSAVHRWNGAAPEHGTGASVPALCPLPRLTWRHAPIPEKGAVKLLRKAWRMPTSTRVISKSAMGEFISPPAEIHFRGHGYPRNWPNFCKRCDSYE